MFSLPIALAFAVPLWIISLTRGLSFSYFALLSLIGSSRPLRQVFISFLQATHPIDALRHMEAMFSASPALNV